jgi:hypothetical protein
LLHSLFDSTSVKEILKISFASLSLEKHIWTPSSNGFFSTKSAYNLITSQRVSSAISPFSSSQWKLLWNLNLNDKLKLFLWKIAWDIVPSRMRLNKVIPIPPSSLVCPFHKVEDFFSSFFSAVFLQGFPGDPPPGL